MDFNVIDFKIEWCNELIKQELREQVRMEGLLKTDEIEFRELPENPAKELAKERLDANRKNAEKFMEDSERRIRVIKLQIADYKKLKHE